ncbi:MAG: hypothetical protein CM15mP55_3000 [Hyphomicrobiales bacterium]|nr:MAG: hypothetical protein CM15mP55_3000 [Hyphomicrobiales bacterium]
MLERFVARIADASMHLHGAVGSFANQPVGTIITHRHFIGNALGNFRLGHCVHLRRRLVNEITYHFAFGMQFGQRKLDRLIGRQSLAERFARALA